MSLSAQTLTRSSAGRGVGRCVLLTPCILAAAVCALPAAAPAKAERARTPTITLVSPMRVKVGGKIAIHGSNFSHCRRRSTVVFRGPDGRFALTKPIRAGRSKLVVNIPASVERLLTGSGKKATRIKLRVLSGRLGRYTSKRISPLVLTSAAATGA